VSENEPDQVRAPVWLVTFGDVVALLLTFFVMLYATAKIPSEEWDAVVGTFSESLQFSQSGMTPNPRSETSIPIVDTQPALSTDYLSGILRDQLGQDVVLRDLAVRSQDDRVSVSLFSGEMFAPGGTELNVEMREAVTRLGGIFLNISNQLEIRGHAGPSIEEGLDFEANQKLSLLRAESVASLIQESGYERNIIIVGLGDSRFAKLDPGLGEERRETLARRVDFIIHSAAENP